MPDRNIRDDEFVYLLTIDDENRQDTFRSVYDTLTNAKLHMMCDIAEQMLTLGESNFKDIQINANFTQYKTPLISWKIERIRYCKSN